MTPKFAIVIPSKTASNVMPCVEAIRRAGHDEQIIVVDDGVDWTVADEGGASWFDFYDPISIVDGIKPFVFARNVNIGIKAAGNDDVLILNDDALLKTPHGFTVLAEAAQREDIGIIGATTNVTGQPLQWPKGIGLREVPHFAFVCVYVPRRTIDKIGMLDERYRVDYGCEDRDYCEAVNRAGLKCAVFDHCYVDHGSLKSSFRGDPKAPKSFAENLKLFKAKWGIA